MWRVANGLDNAGLDNKTLEKIFTPKQHYKLDEIFEKMSEKQNLPKS